jgi:hypothetical protein
MLEPELYAEAMNGLKQKISGYLLQESKKTYIYEEGRRRVKDEVLTTKSVGPDLEAIRFVLTHLNPRLWEAKASAMEELSAADREPAPDLSRLSQAALDELNRLCEG